MIFTLKNYIEVFKTDIGNVKAIDELSEMLYGKTFLGNFLKNGSDFFSYKEIYQLEQEISILKQITIHKNVQRLIGSIYKVYQFIRDKTEFIDYNQDEDLFLISLVKNNLKVYELVRIPGIILNEKEIENLKKLLVKISGK